MKESIQKAESDRAFGPRRGLWRRIKDIALMDVAVLVKGIEEGSVEAMEERLLEADFGVPATLWMVEEIEAEAKKGKLRTEDDFRTFARDRIVHLVGGDEDRSLVRAAEPPTVVLLVGVN
ncbi:MAG: signal recognition particle receptor subunit alpha, partial [Gemmatimonadota bacterium]